MSTYDIASRSLVQLAPLEMARFLLGEPRIQSVRRADPVVVRTERRMDSLMEVEHLGQPFLLHGELQYGWEEDVTQRMLEYGVQGYLVHTLPVLAVVVLLTRKGGRGPDRGRASWTIMGRERLGYDFEILRLWEVDARVHAKEAPAPLLPLVPLMGGATEELVRECGRAIEGSHRPVEERATLLTVLNLFAGLGLGRGASVMMMELWREIMMESPAYEMIQEEGRREGRQEGRAEERLQVGRRMLRKGKSVEEVMELTELTLEEVRGLLEELP